MSGPLKSGQHVRCIDAAATNGVLECGATYVVDVTFEGRLAALHGVIGVWNFDRFEAVPQEVLPDAGLIGAGSGGKPLKFRSGCPVKFIAYIPEAKPHCQLVLLNPATGNTVTRYANGKASTEPYDEPGDILIA